MLSSMQEPAVNQPELPPAEPYDLVVIGSGPAGEKGAAQAAYFGRRVALVEKEAVLGGTAVNSGALPSKTLRETAMFLLAYRLRGLFGVNVSLKDQVTMRDFLYQERLVQQGERHRIMENLRRHKVDVYRGAASFADTQTVLVRPKRTPEIRLRARQILVATGSLPYHPVELPFHDMRVYDADNVLQMPELPPSLLVVGAGPIGCQYASIFAALGVKVWLVAGQERPFAAWDREIVQTLLENMAGMGIEWLTNTAVAEIRAEEELEVKFTSGREIKAHAILSAAGRVGNTGELALENAGLQPDERGFLPVNGHFQTAAPTIYAAGDVIGQTGLASTAMEQARVAMVHAFDLKYKTRLANVLANTIYTIPECSMAGETEETLRQQGIPFVTGRAAYYQNARGLIVGEKNGFLKLLFHAEDMRLLGVHIIGEQASELIHLGAQALLLGAGAELFIQSCFNYPTLSEMYKYATYDAMGGRKNRAAGQVV
mgnify:CR=1 FL=1